ncbi:efflux RND transporter permease subunit [Wenzhouxiangella sediminis]|uniref:RND family transporter n=1 Tax=Wenzhouxiangella sediminis TaxID=1792836 RepID=A0A3E1K837_9GAMM|nr:MMPL family transporter [Wenzhouxiangella sediminis]RFF30137.1 RND family transporter [Wenzhouxiangella sediminis]
MSDSKTMTRRIADAVFSVRPLILLLFVLGTAAMVYYSLQLRVDAGFKKQLPLEHEYMQTFLDYEENFGGANRVMVALIDRDGDMFTPEFFRAFEELSEDVLYVPGVDRSTGRSIFTPNVRFVEVVEDGFAGGNVIPADFSPTPEMLETVRSNIIKSGEVGRLVAEDFSGAMVWVNLMEENPETGEKLDYQQVAAELEEIRSRFENEEHVVRIIGFAKIVGDVADGARGVVMYFGVAFLITAVILLLYSHSVWLTVLPLVCSVTAVVWQLGLLSLLGFGIDPMNILTPFLIFAIGVSHGVQMISGWNAEKLFGGYSPIGLVQEGIPLEQIEPVSSLEASKAVFARLLAPGAIALLSDTIGFLTILLINIQIIQELAITASIGVAVIILTNLVLLPVLLSYVKLRNEEKKRQKQYEHSQKPSIIWDFMAKFTNRGVAVVAVIVGIALFAGAWVKSQEMQIGDSEAGVPELREDARYNRDARAIQERFSLGTDVISVIAQTEASACIESHQIMEAIDRFAWHMRNVEGVQRVITLPMIAKQVNAGWNEGNLRWQILPRDRYALALTTQNIPTDSGLLNRDCSAMPVMIFTEDHKAETIDRVVARAHELQAEIQIEELGYQPGGEAAHGNWPEEGDHPPLVFRLATGNVGVMAATNQEVAAAQTPMLLYVYSAIVVLCLITFRTVLGTLCIVLPLVLVSYLAYSLMAFMGIGLKVNTLPVVALGVGIGVDYGIYIFSRMKGFLDAGVGLDDAYYRTLRLTGRAVFYTAVTLAVGVGTWLFSDLQFQADMGLLLAFMFIFNMIGAMLLLPALARVLLGWREGRKAG